MSPLPSSLISSVPRLQTQRHGKRRVPTEASLFAEDPNPAGFRRAYFRAAGDLVLPPFTTKRVPVHIPQDRGQLRSANHCYEVSPVDADGTIISNNQTVNYSVLPAVLPAVTGQQAVGNTAWVYAFNNTAEYKVIPDHTIVTCGVPVLESPHLVSSLQQVNVEQQIFQVYAGWEDPLPQPQLPGPQQLLLVH